MGNTLSENIAKVDLELLDNITKDVKPQRIFP